MNPHLLDLFYARPGVLPALNDPMIGCVVAIYIFDGSMSIYFCDYDKLAHERYPITLPPVYYDLLWLVLECRQSGQSRIRTCIHNFLDYARAAALPISYLSMAGSILPLDDHTVFLEREPESNRHLFPFGRVLYKTRYLSSHIIDSCGYLLAWKPPVPHATLRALSASIS